MKNAVQSRLGFTLIELLVVVLIIGILTAVALPQYQKAVAKSRAIEIVSFLEAARKSLDLYMLANGTPDKTFLSCDPNTNGITTNNLDELDISLPIDNICENFITDISIEDSNVAIMLATVTDKFDFDVNLEYINNSWKLGCYCWASGIAACQNFKSFPNYSCFNVDTGEAC